MSALDRLGTRVGQFRIVDVLGEGGLGAVYVAVDEKLQRRVALKALHGRRDPAARARLLREARMLSQLQHPHICQIHDLVETEEEDFLVLELVEGRDLARALREGIPPAAQMRIAREIAEALIAAHEQGIVHRDLKPANVMITPSGAVKVLDFGIARSLAPEISTLRLDPDGRVDPDALRRKEAESAGDTEEGSVVGTLGTMSPEQARGESVGPASDMYAFGLLLQHLFTGTPAFEGGLAPRVMLDRAARAESRPVVGLAPDLTRLVERLKAPSPGGRPSARDAADRLRWIQEAPRRRARRIAGAAAVAVLATSTAVMTLQARRIAREAERANREAAAAREVSGFLVELFEVSDPGEARGNTVTAREILDRGAERIEEGLSEQPLARGRLMATMGTVYGNLGLYPEAERLLREALELQERAGADPLDLGRTLGALGGVVHTRGGAEEAGPLLERALAVQEAALGPDDPGLAGPLNDLGIHAYDSGDLDRAERFLVRAEGLLAASPAPDAERHAEVLQNLGNLLVDRGDPDRGERALRRALEIQEADLGSDPPSLAITLNSLAWLYTQRGEHARAVPLVERSLALRRRVLGPTHPQVATAMGNLGFLDRVVGRYDEARRLYGEALALQERAVGRRHPATAIILLNLATIDLDVGALAAAEGRLAEARATIETAYGRRHPDLADVELATGRLRLAQGRDAEAVARIAEAVAVREEAFGATHPLTSAARRQLAVARLRADDLPGAADALARIPSSPDPAGVTTANERREHAAVALTRGDLAAAKGNLAAAREAWSRALDELAPLAGSEVIEVLDLRASALLRLGREAEAETILAALSKSGWVRHDLQITPPAVVAAAQPATTSAPGEP